MLAMCAAAGVLAVTGGRGVVAQEKLGSVEPYLMDRSAETALARSAAPHGIGDGATVLVLTRSGYEEASRGTNGFTCFVGRGWSGVLFAGRDGERTVNPDVFDRTLRAPHCFNEEATRSILPLHRMRTDLLLEGRTAHDVVAETARAVQDGRLAPPPQGAMAYMMSSGQQLGRAGQFRPHVMLYLPGVTGEDWGSPGLSPEYPFVADGGELWAIVVIPTPVFSDGTRPTGPAGG
jgi:hypothetical protein